MAAPRHYNQIPEPDSTSAGRNNREFAEDIHQKARLYRPHGTNLETKVSTLSRFAARLIDRVTGKAYSADELLAMIGTAAPREVETNADKHKLTGIKPGQIVRMSGEADRLEMYLGDNNPDTDPVLVVGKFTSNDPNFSDASVVTRVFPSGYNGVSGKPYYRIDVDVSGASWELYYDTIEGRWLIADGGQMDPTYGPIAAPGDEDYPWEADWSANGEGVISIARHPIGNDKNWEVVGPNTYELFVVAQHAYGTDAVNGVAVGNHVTVSCGWVKEGQEIVIDGALHVSDGPGYLRVNGWQVAGYNGETGNAMSQGPMRITNSGDDRWVMRGGPLRGSLTVPVEGDNI